MENVIKKFLMNHGICRDQEKIVVINEYRDDKYPQVYKIIDGLENRTFKIRITLNRRNAVKVEKIVCNMLEKKLCDNFYPKLLDEYVGDSLLGDVLIMEYCPGESLAMILEQLDKAEKRQIVCMLTKYVKRIHEIKNETFTTFNGLYYDQWLEFYRKQMDIYLQGVQKRRIIESELVAKIYNIIYTNEISCDSPTLVYYDLKPDNIIFDRENSQVYLVDFEIARFVDPFMEISRGEFLCGLFDNDIYRKDIWIPFVEGMLGIKYDSFIDSKTMKLYMLYHNLSYLNYFFELENKIDQRSMLTIQNIVDSLF